MKSFLIYSFLFSCLIHSAQDKVYFLDGTCKSGKITEISNEQITLDSDETQFIPRELVLLLEFSNGKAELINKPSQTVIYTPVAPNNKRSPARKTLFLPNVFSINTLALCNADISAFYERILPKKTIGLGVMGAYNFNHLAGLQNLFIILLSNAKKNYDIGAFANFYSRPGFAATTTTFQWGILVKYLNFSFSKVIEETAGSGSMVSTTIKYVPAKGSQLATIFTFGTNTPLSKTVYLKSIFGFGGFNLRGDYKQQYNYYLNNAPSTNTVQTKYNRSFLLKLYFGLNIGYNF